MTDTFPEDTQPRYFQGYVAYDDAGNFIEIVSQRNGLHVDANGNEWKPGSLRKEKKMESQKKFTGYPAESINGDKLEIISSRVRDGIRILIDANGNEWKASTRPLKLELVNAVEVISEDVKDVAAEAQEAVDEIADAVGDAIEEVGGAVEELVADVKEEAALIVDEVQDLAYDVIEGAGSLVDEWVANVEDLTHDPEVADGNEAEDQASPAEAEAE
jgi:ElaB/YqjD/DUF883 family membrane-anchored ribosome-binding protein